jgi:YidC/Oxa1 family membrane protein insertase
MERNQAIGFTLIMLLLMLYFWLSFNDKGQQQPPVRPKQQTQTLPQIPLRDSLTLRKEYGSLAQFARGNPQQHILENQDLKIIFSSKGGSIQQVLLKNYKTYHQKPLLLVDSLQTQMSKVINLPEGKTDLSQLYFSLQARTDSSLTYRLSLDSNRYLEQRYSLGKKGFELSYQTIAEGINLDKQALLLSWAQAFHNMEKDIKQTREKSTVTYYTEEEGFDHLSEASNEPQEKKLEGRVHWVAFKEKFFLAALIADTSMAQVRVRGVVNPSDTLIAETLSADLPLLIDKAQNQKAHYRFFFGPNDYQVVSQVTDGFRQNVFLGIPILSGINRFLIIPIFRLLESFILNYGLLITVLVVVVKLLLFPLNYRSYMSAAKMRVMNQLPEMVEIKEKHKEDPQKQQQETLKMYTLVGVNPLSGCIPVLLQMPILFALFQLFPNMIEFRQKAFLWAEDLSTYDTVAMLPFSIPFGYGDHVSLFTILMTISTLVYTYYTNQMTPTTPSAQQPFDPRIIAYTSPVIFMFVLNSFPAGLSFYYFVSNVISVLQQIVIRRFVDEDKIEALLQQNKLKNKDKPKSKFSQRFEEAMKAAEEQRKQQVKQGPQPDKRKKK